MNHQLALQEIEKFTRVFKAFSEAQNALTALASLDQNVKELEIQKENVITSLALEEERLASFKVLAKEEKAKLVAAEEKKKITLENSFKIEQERLQGVFNEFKSRIDTETSNLEANRDLVSLNLSKLKIKVSQAQEELSMLENKIIDVRKQIALMLKE